MWPLSDPVVPIAVKRGTLSLPQDNMTPLIMVGPGTGCAIFRAFLQHRAALKLRGEPVGPCAFFFGCRHEGKDYLYRNEWESYVQMGVLTVFGSFSPINRFVFNVTHVFVQALHSVATWIKMEVLDRRSMSSIY